MANSRIVYVPGFLILTAVISSVVLRSFFLQQVKANISVNDIKVDSEVFILNMESVRLDSVTLRQSKFQWAKNKVIYSKLSLLSTLEELPHVFQLAKILPNALALTIPHHQVMRI